jgi:hypothetical protein
MKLNPHGLAGAATPNTAESSGTQRVDRGTAAGSLKPGSLAEDRLELSSLVGSIARAEAASILERAGHVKALAKLYKSGGYATDAGALSRKLVEEALASRATGAESS